MPYIAVIIWAATAWIQISDRSLALSMLAFSIIVFILLCIPTFLAVIRALEWTLAEQLLELSIPTPPRRPTWSDRLRGARFYFGRIRRPTRRPSSFSRPDSSRSLHPWHPFFSWP
ncbi:hypothetical protein SAMN04489752_1003 [Brevibacterium siliguriense]|uniref:Uncharacterized protein n=1 Tax=Brevibacterium siliguriense TaxID=1136497 RepID=A0A1H1PI20_9MICO|nr:hypothetical protein [Brevibacterium siliguriense]SDS10951.1 hypothetical protein SAMN04489752_1003 [Brevibacterium siliguriense]